jgi:DNA-binding CsgD family transcriptional regulator
LAKTPHLNVAGEHLRAARATDQAKLRRLVTDVTGAAIALGDGFGAPIHLRAVALSMDAAAEMWFPGCIGLFLSELGNPPNLDLGELGSLFGLTPAEARLAAALVAGASVSEYAEERGIALGTARVQMKQVLAKTSTGRQPELVRQLCSSVTSSTFPQSS